MFGRPGRPARRRRPVRRAQLAGVGSSRRRDAAAEIAGRSGGRPATTASSSTTFTDPELDTRFLGDLYQDLSEAARKKYALLQTPEFVEEFILDRTLDAGDRRVRPATRSRLIDPTCGSGHFLLGAFDRLLDAWAGDEPALGPRERVQTARSTQVDGVDLNPFAVAIARFRLLVAALRAVRRHAARRRAGASRSTSPSGDSLLHGASRRRDQGASCHWRWRRRVRRYVYAPRTQRRCRTILGRAVPRAWSATRRTSRSRTRR